MNTHCSKDTVIILLNWNSGNKTFQCIDSLLKISQTGFDIVIVDNGSTDGSIEGLRGRYPNLHYILFKKNTGFCKANNAALKYALKRGYRYFILLNNDMLVDKSWLINLMRTAKELPDAGIVGAKILFKQFPGIINSTGVVMNLLGYCWDRNFGLYDKDAPKNREKVFAVTGGCMLIRKEVIESIGFLNERYFAYYEDVEYCARLRRLTDYEIYYVPEAVCYHEFSASTDSNKVLKYQLVVRNYWLNISLLFSADMLIKYGGKIIFNRIKNEFRERYKNGQFYLLVIELLGISKFPFFVLSNLRLALDKNYAVKYYPYLLHEVCRPAINIVNIERESKGKWKYF